MPTKKMNDRESELDSLKRRLKEAEETLDAIRHGEVDALVVQTVKGDQVFTLRSADHPYRVLVESMGEGALTLSDDGVILHANQAFARLTRYPHSRVIGSSIFDFFKAECLGPLTGFLNKPGTGRSQRAEFQLQPKAGPALPILLSATRLQLEEEQVTCAVVTDLSDIRAAEHALRRARDELETRVRQRTAELREARDALEQRVRERTDELRRLTDYLDRVREEESKRIANEIHDELGAALTSAKLELAWLVQSLKDSEQLKKAENIGLVLDDLIRAIRRISHDLRPSVLDTFGLSAGIEALVDEFKQRTRVQCRLRITTDGGKESQALALYRICQEALTNVSRHAEATRVDVSLVAEDNKLILRVKDNGKGMPPGTLMENGSGLLGMRERAKRLGGELVVSSTGHKGTEVEAWVPLPTTPEIRPAS
jgi:PAS domain S-box-containing protein